MFTIDTFNLGSPLGEKSGLGYRRGCGKPQARSRTARGRSCGGKAKLFEAFSGEARRAVTALPVACFWVSACRT